MKLSSCKIAGMLSIGKINPDNIIVGSIKAINEMNIATIWFFADVDIRIPRHKAIVMNKTDSNKSRLKLPVMGTPNTNLPRIIITKELVTDSNKPIDIGLPSASQLKKNKLRMDFTGQTSFQGRPVYL